MVKVIIYLPGQSNYTPRVDEFRRCGEEMGRRLVWKGRALTVEEFNKEFPGIIENSRLKWSYEPIVEIVEEKSDEPVAPPEKVKESTPKAEAKPAVEVAKKSRGRPTKVKAESVPQPAPVAPPEKVKAQAAKVVKGPRFHMLPV